MLRRRRNQQQQQQQEQQEPAEGNQPVVITDLDSQYQVPPSKSIEVQWNGYSYNRPSKDKPEVDNRFRTELSALKLRLEHVKLRKRQRQENASNIAHVPLLDDGPISNSNSNNNSSNSPREVLSKAATSPPHAAQRMGLYSKFRDDGPSSEQEDALTAAETNSKDHSSHRSRPEHSQPHIKPPVPPPQQKPQIPASLRIKRRARQKATAAAAVAGTSAPVIHMLRLQSSTSMQSMQSNRPSSTSPDDNNKENAQNDYFNDYNDRDHIDHEHAINSAVQNYQAPTPEEQMTMEQERMNRFLSDQFQEEDPEKEQAEKQTKATYYQSDERVSNSWCMGPALPALNHTSNKPATSSWWLPGLVTTLLPRHKEPDMNKPPPPAEQFPRAPSSTPMTRVVTPPKQREMPPSPKASPISSLSSPPSPMRAPATPQIHAASSPQAEAQNNSPFASPQRTDATSSTLSSAGFSTESKSPLSPIPLPERKRIATTTVTKDHMLLSSSHDVANGRHERSLQESTDDEPTEEKSSSRRCSIFGKLLKRKRNRSKEPETQNQTTSTRKSISGNSSSNSPWRIQPEVSNENYDADNKKKLFSSKNKKKQYSGSMEMIWFENHDDQFYGQEEDDEDDVDGEIVGRKPERRTIIDGTRE